MTTSSPVRLHYGWIVLAMSTLVVFGSLGLARFSYSVVLPSMQQSLGFDNAQVGVIATVELTGYLLVSVFGGVLAARYGPRVVITFGLLGAGVGMLLTSRADSFVAVAVSRALAGMGSGGSNVPAMALLPAWFGPRRRGLAAGVAVGGSSLGIVVVGPLVPRVIAAVGAEGWRVCWLLFGLATIGLAVMSWLVLRNRPDERGLARVGETDVELRPASRTAGLQWGRVYRAAPVWHLGSVYIAFGLSYIIYVTFFTKRLTAEGGYTLSAAGALFMVLGISSLPCGLIWGGLSDRIGRKQALVAVYLMHTVAYGLFALWPTPVGFTLSAILFGLSAWSIPAIMSAAAGDILGPTLAPAALGFLTLFFGVGQALGPALAGLLADGLGAVGPVFLLASGVALLGAVGALGLRTVRPTVETAPV